MANLSTLFKITIKGGDCIPGLSEDTLRQLANSLTVVAESVTEDLEIVTSTPGIPVKIDVDTFGNVSATIKLNGGPVDILAGTKVGIFKGSPTATNPGNGWKVLIDETKQALNQPDNEAQWTLFLAERTGAINTFSS